MVLGNIQHPVMISSGCRHQDIFDDSSEKSEMFISMYGAMNVVMTKHTISKTTKDEKLAEDFLSALKHPVRRIAIFSLKNNPNGMTTKNLFDACKDKVPNLTPSKLSNHLTELVDGKILTYVQEGVTNRYFLDTKQVSIFSDYISKNLGVKTL